MTKLDHGIAFGLLPAELIVDNFAGGGGASLGIEMALGRSPDIAINHDPEAIAMHKANHPDTHHFCEDVWAVNPIEACAGRPVGLAWFSPDCKHFSKAKGGKPVSKKIRGLAWIVVKWAKAVQPRVIILENVEEFQDWGPLDDENRPCPQRKGKTFQRWLAQLRNLGYMVEWRELRACDYSAPTIRKRLFIVARRDGQRIIWPEPTHVSPKKLGTDLFTSHLKPWRTAAECIDWSIPCPSIFERGRPLAANTLRRVAAGLKRFVIESPEPFIVRTAHGTTGPNSRRWGKGEHSINDPLPTVAASGDFAIVTPFLAGVGGRAGQSPERSPRQPYQTVTSKADAAIVAPLLVGAGGPARSGEPRSTEQPFITQTGRNNARLVTAFLAKHYGGVVGTDMEQPIGTVTAADHHSLVAATLLHNTTGNPSTSPAEPLKTVATGGHHGIVTSNLVKLRGTCRHGQAVDEPMATVSAQGLHLAEVRAFLIAYYGNERDGAPLTEPMRTTTSKERFGLVTIHGEEYVIADIGLRMLTPRELYRAQGFTDWEKSFTVRIWPDRTTYEAGNRHYQENREPAKSAEDRLSPESGLESSEPVAVFARIDLGRRVLVLRSAARWLRFANSAEESVSYPLPTEIVDSALRLAPTDSCGVHITLAGRAAEQPNGRSSIPHQNGAISAAWSGEETMLLAVDAANGMNMEIEASRFTISRDGQHSLACEATLKTLSCFGANAIASFIPGETLLTSSFVVDLTVEKQYIIDPLFEGKPLSKTAQVRMCGNSVCPPNAAAMVRAQFGMSPHAVAA